MKHLILTAHFIWVCLMGYSQQYTISGTIEDSETGEQLVSANVYEAASLTGSTSNFYGFYSLRLPKGKIKLVCSYIGYRSVEIEMALTRDTALNIKLEPDLLIEEVTITDKGPAATVRSSQMSIVEIPMIQTKQLPVLFGEVDIIKTIQLMPGVQGGTEGLSGMYVRGGGPSENLILLDGVPVYNLSHLFGFFSIFNADAIHSFNLYKGGFPARYGGRLSSVLDIKMKEGNMNEFKGSGSIGLISSKLMLEGPIVKNKASFMVSGRRSYIDVLTWPIQKYYNNSQDDYEMLFGYYLYDVNAKVNYKFSDKSRLYLSMYSGKDKAYDYYKSKSDNSYYETMDGETRFYENYYEDKWDMSFWWGNVTSALRWNYIISPKLFCNVAATYSRYRMQIDSDGEYTNKYVSASDTSYRNSEYYFAYYSGIEDLGLKADFDFIPSPNHYLRFGFGNTYHTFSPGVTIDRSEYKSYDSDVKMDTTYGAEDIHANEMALYIEDDIRITDKLKLNIGIRTSAFQVKKENYYSLEPRLSARYMINDRLSVKGSFAYMQQYIHLLTNSSMSLPTDLWMPVTDAIEPMHSWQVASGMALNLGHGFEFTFESYYKQLHGGIEYKEGVSYFDFKGGWENNVEAGFGETYGFEVMIQRQQGNTKGWIGYTLAWAERKFDNISFGKTFPFKYDRRHDLSIVLTHSLSNGIDFGINWVFGTGYPFTFGDQLYPSLLAVQAQNQQETPFYRHYGTDRGFMENIETRNNYRLPNYHRLDIGLTFNKEKKNYTRSFAFGVYNMYNRLNAFMVYQDYKYYYGPDGHERPPKKELKQISFFPVIPYVRWSFSF
jgi:hypothetical protein